VANALSNKYTLLVMIETKILEFDDIRKSYKDYNDFSLIFCDLFRKAHIGFFLNDGFLFREKIYIPKGSLKDSFCDKNTLR